MSDYNSIKALVIDQCISIGSFPSYEKLTVEVLKYFPTSKWQKTHYAWYKSKIKRGEIVVPGFSSAESNNTNDEDLDNNVAETIDASLSLEKDLHSYLARNVDDIEEGLVLQDDGIEFQTDAGRIDLLAMDSEMKTVVIELKAGKAKDSALGQLLGYVGCISESAQSNGNVRGILVASDFEPRVVFAAKALPNVKLVKYNIVFNLVEVKTL